MTHRIGDIDAYLATIGDPELHEYRGDATPWYLYSEAAAESIASLEPDSRIIIMLRDPVEMIASLHNHHVYLGIEPEQDLESAVFHRGRSGPGDFRHYLDYLSVASLSAQVQRYLDRFAAERILVIDFERLAADPGALHLEILERLDIPAIPLGTYPHLNKGRRVRSRMLDRLTRSDLVANSRRARGVLRRVNTAESESRIPDSLRSRIVAELEEDSERLRVLLGQSPETRERG